jgi:hypothetical protein
MNLSGGIQDLPAFFIRILKNRGADSLFNPSDKSHASSGLLLIIYVVCDRVLVVLF